MNLVIDDKIPFIRGEAERLGETSYLPGSAITTKDVRDADALIIRTRTRCNRSLLEGSRVKFIATATIGYDHLDTAWLKKAGIAWSNCPGCNADSVAQYVKSALLLLQLSGRLRLDKSTTLGIVGVGHVGTKVALMARKMGLNILLCDPPRAERQDFLSPTTSTGTDITDEACTATLDDVCNGADIITFHTPLTRQGLHATWHLADRSFFTRLKRQPVFINASRGEVVDTSALKAAISEGRVRSAVIDTWENEPKIDRELLRAAFIATPHIAGYSADGKANGTRMALSAVARHFGIDTQFHISPPAIPADFLYYPDCNEDRQHPALALYDPRRDSIALKTQPEAFEFLRGNYPLRRESFNDKSEQM